MKLGNSNGANSGKRYIKLTGAETISPEREKAAGLFFYWLEKNYKKLRRSLAAKGVYDESIFSDTCYNMYEAIAFKKLDIKCYGSYFSRSYFTNTVLESSKETKKEKIHFDIAAAWNIPDSVSAYTVSISGIDCLTHDIFNYVHTSYPPHESALFEIYLKSELSLSYKELSLLTRVPYYTVATSLSSIFKDVRHSFVTRKGKMIE
jgi:hypothetical protein